MPAARALAAVSISFTCCVHSSSEVRMASLKKAGAISAVSGGMAMAVIAAWGKRVGWAAFS